jgi:uncharacterized cupredoxin-like copper-binding protein
MPTASTHDDQRSQTLEEELHELEGQEKALERRTGSLELGGWLTMIVAIVALFVAAAALVVAFSAKGSGPERIVRETVSANGGAKSAANAAGSTKSGAANPGAMMGSSASTGGGAMMKSTGTSHAAMMGVGGHGSFTAAQVAAAKHWTVYVQLGDYWAAPTVSSVKAGKVTFIAKNVGRVPHELMVERMPIKFNAPNQPNEDAAQGMIDDMMSGQSGHMTVHLTPGTYMLFCNAPGHYMMGQHILFKVTKS